MALRILDDTTASAVYAATTQAAQLAALLAPWGAADVTAKIYDGATLRDTLTLDAFAIDTSPLPRRLICGALLDRTNASTGAMTRIVFANDTDDIFECSAGVGSGDIQFDGNIRALCVPQLAGAEFTAWAAFPPVDPIAVTTVAADLMWTHGTDSRAIFHNNATWIGSIKSTGWVAVYHFDHNTGVSNEYQLANLSQNDHHSPALLALPDGRVACHYQGHNADTHSFVRITTNPNDPTAWDAAIQVESAELVGYAHTFYLSASGKYYVAYRVNVQEHYVTSTDASGDFSSWDAERCWIINGGNRPYPKMRSNGVDRIDIAFIQGHPNSVVASVYHCYMQLDAGVEKFYKTDGTYISTGSVTPVQATLVFDGTVDGEAWIWDVMLGSDGHPRVLFVRYESTTDHQHMFSRWTGSAWTTAVEIGASAPFADEPLTDPGVCFDGNSVDIVYRGHGTGIPFEMQEWRTSDNGATWSKHRDITTGTSGPNFHARPYSPAGHDGTVACVWCYGTIVADDLTDWSTVGKGVGSA